MEIINIKNSLYPPLLKETYKPPGKLFCRGDMSVLNKNCISVVGTRFYSDYGEYVTEKIIRELAILDIAIVSGLARGIDTIAHKTALKYGLKTIAVLGSGLNNIYPPENMALAEKIEKNGALITEYPEDTAPVQMNFPQRNRIISGISIATIVSEAPDKSGALITADFALEQGREIFAIPGDIDRKGSGGVLKLIRKGAAHPVSSGEEIIEIIKKQPLPFRDCKASPAGEDLTAKNTILKNCKLSPEEKLIIEAIGSRRGNTLEKVVEQSGLTVQQALTTLSFLEINGLIHSKKGKYKLKDLFKPRTHW